ncbi:hypothetical protein [Cyclobacterium marinum]|uniref:hypothetical protein n=1 Tax=Cyclobacterium marinum TaxID=104 RepID=UPI0011EE4EE7|nr:hypothetical protein [Cyclobacterium marinum]MBI0400423.1 hypothetical protein [Cyclobacterium marinum]
MTETEAIVTAAKHYCIDNFRYWSERYQNERTGNDFPYTYTDNDYNLFPRYNALSAIRQGIDYFTGKEFHNIESCKQTLIKSGKESQSPFTEKTQNKIEQKAIQEERDKFVQFIDNIESSDLETIEPLPYRRRLKDDEQEKIRQVLTDKWRVDGYWVPLIESSPEVTTIFLDKENLTEKDETQIANFIKQKAEGRLYEITEEQLDYEIDRSEFDIDCYETFYCDITFNWLVYGSHEGTLAFGGKELLDFVQQVFADRKEMINNW